MTVIPHILDTQWFPYILPANRSYPNGLCFVVCVAVWGTVSMWLVFISDIINNYCGVFLQERL